MLETAEVPTSSLPKGCTEILPKGRATKLTTRVLKPKDRWQPKDWNRTWEIRERNIQNIFEAIVKALLMKSVGGSELQSILNEVHSETNLTHRILLSRGLEDLKAGRLVVTTNNRIGIKGAERGPLVVGGRFHFRFQVGRRSTGMRRVEGKIIGLVLNANSRFAKPYKKGEERGISDQQLLDTAGSLIDAYLALNQARAQEGLSEYLFQEELNRAINWAIFGKAD